MDGSRKSKDRSVSRRYEANRLADEVLAVAYDQVWPLFRKVVDQNSSSPQNESEAAPSAVTIVARSA